MKDKRSDEAIFSGRSRLVTIIACILVGVIFFLFLINIKSRIDEYASYTLRSQVQMATVSIDAKLNDAKRSIVTAAGDVALRWEDGDSDYVVNLLESIKDDYPFDVLEFVDKDGYNLMSGSNRFNASDREYYKKGIKGEIGLWINFEPKESQEYLLDYYAPVYNKGEIVGILVGAIGSKSSLEELTKTSYFGRDSIGVLFNEDKRAIAASFGAEGEMYDEDIYDMFSLTEADKEVFRLNVSNKDGGVFGYEGSKGRGIACTGTIESYEWGLIIIIPSNTFASVYGDFTSSELIAIGAISIIVCIYILYILGVNNSRYRAKLKEHRDIIEGFSKVYHSVFVINYSKGHARCIKTRDPAAAKYGITEGAEFSILEVFMNYLLSESSPEERDNLLSISNVMYVKTMLEGKEYLSIEFNQRSGGKGNIAMANLWDETIDNQGESTRYIIGLTEIG